MKATLRLSERLTYAEYLALEQMSEFRHELIDGVMVAMAGGSREHNAIVSKAAFLLTQRLRPPCLHYSSDQRFWIASSARARYSDGSIVCGKPESRPHDDQAFTNPVVVLEVLSPSSEGDDDGDKRQDFQSLVSLQAYVLIHQDERRVKIYRRAETGEWPPDGDVYVDGDRFELPTLSEPIRVADLYEGILNSAGRSLLR
jgi:Uma2 family endonuclease